MITFSTQVYPNITMYRADALAMIDKMGHSATTVLSCIAGLTGLFFFFYLVYGAL